ncbi:MAG: hypothetical protein GY810_18990 [Aureispira sp.]|nr:hypothetical protein [Aureispira sp.]
MAWKEALKTVGAAVAIATAKLIPIMIVGCILNWIFIIMYGSSIWTALTPIDTGRSPFSAIVLVPALLVVFMFILGFPILYFLVGKSYALKCAIRHIFKKSAPSLFQYFVPKVVEYAGDTYQTNDTVLQARDMHDNFAKKMTNMSWPLRMLYNFALNKIPFKEKFDEITGGLDLVESNYDEIGKRLSQELASKVEEKFLGASLKNFWILLLVNIASMVILVKFVI